MYNYSITPIGQHFIKKKNMGRKVALRGQKFIKKYKFGQKGGPVPPKASQGSASAPGPWCHFNGDIGTEFEA